MPELGVKGFFAFVTALGALIAGLTCWRRRQQHEHEEG